mmetsp:Transcript_30002/g.101131  ORF Transcript_30002/g.101131 Transcript_30002/m.101131 type:complete len:203 (-) Transcript_30002:41-649(-)|eukprot:CAMPEP_0206832156 /NCGR_PEP_ID=MMETSP0975-20121206/17748_1 /ASSEMBLY_ACC=CAM_ASM_000399 /TAXON_ID=483370 /ORGANISM="non described non described, Strain CCMP2097" /LENGTH=202 /DNA_ID=CAMNT_0054374541 /DNA_START=39 /DNA_END=647 /DNA_ORIENTATION=+
MCPSRWLVTAFAVSSAFAPQQPKRAAPPRRSALRRSSDGGDWATRDGANMGEELARRAEELAREERRAAKDRANAQLLAQWTHGWIILFGGSMDSDDCAVHAISTPGRETVLAFESSAQAAAFASRLEETGLYYTARAEEVLLENLSEWLDSDARIRLVAVPFGTSVTIPDRNADDLDFTPRGKTDDVEAQRRALEVLFGFS